MRKRKLVTKPIIKKATEIARGDFADTTDLQIILEAGAPLIAEKALNDFADYFLESGAAVGIDPKVTKAVANIARRYATSWIA